MAVCWGETKMCLNLHDSDKSRCLFEFASDNCMARELRLRITSHYITNSIHLWCLPALSHISKVRGPMERNWTSISQHKSSILYSIYSVFFWWAILWPRWSLILFACICNCSPLLIRPAVKGSNAECWINLHLDILILTKRCWCLVNVDICSIVRGWSMS